MIPSSACRAEALRRRSTATPLNPDVPGQVEANCNPDVAAPGDGRPPGARDLPRSGIELPRSVTEAMPMRCITLSGAGLKREKWFRCLPIFCFLGKFDKT